MMDFYVPLGKTEKYIYVGGNIFFFFLSFSKDRINTDYHFWFKCRDRITSKSLVNPLQSGVGSEKTERRIQKSHKDESPWLIDDNSQSLSAEAVYVQTSNHFC